MSGVNANRKYDPQAEPDARVSLHVPAELAREPDKSRGSKSRNSWILRACRAALDGEGEA